MTATRVTALVLALTTISWTSRGTVTGPAEVSQLGTVKVDDYTGLVLFQDLADDGKSYRVTLAIPKPWEAPSIKSERIEVWLLARHGKALATNTQPEDGELVEAGSAGATANAMFFFDRSVEPSELRAVVVAVDGNPIAFKVTPEK